jgi:hypothetical protein
MASPTRSAAQAVKQSIDDAVAALEKAGYRIDLFLKPAQPESPEPPATTNSMTATPGSAEDTQQEPVHAKPVGPADRNSPPEDD